MLAAQTVGYADAAGGFVGDAQQAAIDRGILASEELVQIALIDGDVLVSLLVEHNIGIEHKDVTVLDLCVKHILEKPHLDRCGG